MRGDPDIPLRMVELLCSRLCHDLSGPVGAIRNGVELLDDMGSDAETAALVADSSRRAAARLRLFRLAYGQAGIQPAGGFTDVRAAFVACLEGGKVQLSWPDEAAPTDPPPGLAKLLLNGLILGDESLPRGGTLGIRQIGPLSGGAISLTAEGTAIRFDADMKAALRGTLPLERMDTRSVQAAITQRIARNYGFDISLLMADRTRIELDIRL